LDLALAREHGLGIQALVVTAPATSDVADAVPLTMSAPEARREHGSRNALLSHRLNWGLVRGVLRRVCSRSRAVRPPHTPYGS